MAHSKMSQSRNYHADNIESFHFLLVGCAGSGKSATGNSILLGNYFEESNEAFSTTKLPMTATADPFKTGQQITVTDTPDITETWLNSDTMEGINFLSQISPGPHAILVVISARMRISTEIEDKLKVMCNALGDSATRHMILVFTSIDTLRTSSKNKQLIPLEKYVSEVREKNSFMNLLLEKCGMRYIGFNNVVDPLQHRHEAKTQLENLLQMMIDFRRYKVPLVVSVENAMIRLDKKTGSRNLSRNKLPEILGLVESRENNCLTSRMSKSTLTYFGVFSFLTAGASTVGVMNPAVIIPGGCAIAYLGNTSLRQWRKSSYTKMEEAIESYQPESNI